MDTGPRILPPQNVADTGGDECSIRLRIGLAAPPDTGEVKGFCILEGMDEDRLHFSFCENEGFSWVEGRRGCLGHLSQDIAKGLEDSLTLWDRS